MINKYFEVAISYADGIPRNLSEQNVRALIRGNGVPIIGKICMNRLLIDITDIESIQMSDTVTLIGKDQTEEIRCTFCTDKKDVGLLCLRRISPHSIHASILFGF